MTISLYSGEERWLSYSIAHSSRPQLKQSFSFEATSSRDFAEILCCLDYKLYRRIPVSAEWVVLCVCTVCGCCSSASSVPMPMLPSPQTRLHASKSAFAC